ncbi:MAG: hypothetical protein QG620_621 [Patescibacteria group bacterium]|nr:hypothetical protein [Patescibacteria group bacterium]
MLKGYFLFSLVVVPTLILAGLAMWLWLDNRKLDREMKQEIAASRKNIGGAI